MEQVRDRGETPYLFLNNRDEVTKLIYIFMENNMLAQLNEQEFEAVCKIAIRKFIGIIQIDFPNCELGVAYMSKSVIGVGIKNLENRPSVIILSLLTSLGINLVGESVEEYSPIQFKKSEIQREDEIVTSRKYSVEEMRTVEFLREVASYHNENCDSLNKITISYNGTRIPLLLCGKNEIPMSQSDFMIAVMNYKCSEEDNVVDNTDDLPELLSEKDARAFIKSKRFCYELWCMWGCSPGNKGLY